MNLRIKNSILKRVLILLDLLEIPLIYVLQRTVFYPSLAPLLAPPVWKAEVLIHLAFFSLQYSLFPVFLV